jgi:hypothetical protein
LAYNYWEEKLREVLDGLEKDPVVVAGVLDYLVRLGVGECVLSMVGYFDSGFIADFVCLTRLFGDPAEIQRGVKWENLKES